MSRRPDPIARWLALRVESGAVPGGAWWVEGGAGVVSRGAAGCSAIVPARESASEDVPYDLASLTKPLCTALVAAILEQEGRIDLEAPVGDLLVELSGSRWAGATLLDLGAHRAGLPPWRPLYLEASSLEGYLLRIAREPRSDPETTGYSDLGFILLGAAVERAAGEKLDRLFEKLVARPLGLARTRFAPRGRPVEAAAPTESGNRHERDMAGEAGAGFAWRTALIRGEVHDVNAHVLGGVAGHAGLFGTAAEVARIAREILAPRELALGAPARERLLAPAAGSSERSFGFVLARGSEAARGVLPDGAPGHVGFTGTSVWLDPASGEVYVLLTNRVHPVVREVDFQVERREFHRRAARSRRRG